MRYKYTKEDIEFLKKNYPIGNWDEIHERFNNISDSAIQHKCSRLGIKFNNEYKVKYDSNIHYRNAYSVRTAHPFRRNGAPFRFKLSKAQQVD